MSSQPLVSVVCIAYNHAKYISQAIDGILMQEVDFPFEIIIHDDCSTDSTQELIQEYADKHPELIKTFFQKENQYSLGSKILPIVLPFCKGKYLAICEGDDYWTDPNKLQKQVSFLEENLDYSICFHNAKILKDGFFVDNYLKRIVGETTTILDLARDNYIYTASCLIRNVFSDGLPEFFNSSPAGDYPLLMLAAQKGNIRYIDEIMSVYRIHEGGIWSTKNAVEKLEASARVQKILMENFHGEVGAIIKDQHINLLNRIINEYKAEIRIVNDPYFIHKNAMFSVIVKALLVKIRSKFLR